MHEPDVATHLFTIAFHGTQAIIVNVIPKERKKKIEQIFLNENYLTLTNLTLTLSP